MTQTCRFVCLAVSAVDAPPSTSGASFITTHLAAIAMLIANRDVFGAWTFTSKRRAIAAGESEDVLLAWMIEVMPREGSVVGWRLAEAILPPLLEASATGNPEICCAFIERLTSLLAAPSVDLAVGHGGAAAPPLGVVAAAQSIALPLLSADELMGAWALGNTGHLEIHAEAQAIATWQLWMAEASGAACGASTAFADWLAC